MEKERSFIKETEIHFKVSLCMVVNSVKESTLLTMDECMRDTFIMVIAMVWVSSLLTQSNGIKVNGN